MLVIDRYAPASMETVQAVLDLGNLKPGERYVDLGSGDGRFVVEAAKRGAIAAGYELDGELAGKSRPLIEAAGGEILRRDLFTFDFQADLITANLSAQTNEWVRSNFEQRSPAGARLVLIGENDIVCHSR